MVLAKKKMNKRKPSPRAQKQTSCKKKKLQTKKAKGGKAAASSGEREEQETKGTSAVISRSNPLFFFPELARTAHSRFIMSHSSYVFSALLTSDTVWRWTRVSAFSSTSLAFVPFVRPFDAERTVARTHERTNHSEREHARTLARHFFSLFRIFSSDLFLYISH